MRSISYRNFTRDLREILRVAQNDTKHNETVLLTIGPAAVGVEAMVVHTGDLTIGIRNNPTNQSRLARKSVPTGKENGYNR